MTVSILRWTVLTASLLLLNLPLPVQALPNDLRVPGGVAVVPLAPISGKMEKLRAWFGEQPVWVTADRGHWIAIVGLDLKLPAGPHELRVNDGKQEHVVRFNIRTKRYPEQHITLKDKGKVTLSPTDEARALVEIDHIRKLKRHWREDDSRTVIDSNLQLPAQGRISSRFGLQRFFNGEARAPHSGIDIALPRDTPVKSSAKGQVLSIGDYFFNGKTIFIDHGNGLISMYCHLDRIDVKANEIVSQGKRIGLSGMTGRSSGPHLHWSVVLNGAMVDPSLFFGND